MKRVLTTLVLVPTVIWICLWSPQLVLLAATSIVASLCFREFRRFAAAHSMAVPGPLGYAAGLIILLVPSVHISLLFVAVALTLLLALRSDDLKSVLPSAAGLSLALIYIYGAWRCGIELRLINPHLLLYALSINWVGDVAAYFTGSAIGRHKLAPRVSPGKSWEGFFGSLLFTSAYGVAYLHYFQPDMPLPYAAALTATANIGGQLGDLVESAMKRGAGMKDSGTMLPGHGGWLDRLDSSLFSLPIVYFWLRH
ncbi:MAG: phosphatidate cytidylyltransferase [Acidobacteria bacterium]|nr:phosphatidate cytidylyltransferase [Acidobacteriota bacterium]